MDGDATPQIDPYIRPAAPAVRQPTWPTRARAIGWSAVAGVVAVAALMLLTSPAKLPERGASIERDAARHYAMTAPSLSGRLRDGRAYGVVADSARLSPDDPKVILLAGVRAAMQSEDGGRVDLTAASARFDRAGERMTLTGDVVATRSDGYSLSTEEIDIWQAEGGLAARSDAPTEVTGPDGRAEGAGMTATPGLRNIRLTGPVTIRLRGGALE